MGAPRIFVNHSHEDKDFCDALVRALRAAGADVWYDEHGGAGQLFDIIQIEVQARAIFLVVLSKAAIASEWVRRECIWAYSLTDGNPSRTLLPVTAGAIEPNDLMGNWFFIKDYRRIEAPGYNPLRRDVAIEQALRTLGLMPAVKRQIGQSPAQIPVLLSAPHDYTEDSAQNGAGSVYQPAPQPRQSPGVIEPLWSGSEAGKNWFANLGAGYRTGSRLAVAVLTVLTAFAGIPLLLLMCALFLLLVSNLNRTSTDPLGWAIWALMILVLIICIVGTRIVVRSIRKIVRVAAEQWNIAKHGRDRLSQHHP